MYVFKYFLQMPHRKLLQPEGSETKASLYAEPPGTCQMDQNAPSEFSKN
jgi:hypothetical protein